MYMQDHLKELNGAIINIYENRIELTGFLSKERLLDYYHKGNDCRSLICIYPVEKFDISYVKDNSLIIIIEDGEESHKYNFVPIKTDTITYKDEENKLRSRTCTIRECSFTGKYSYKDNDKSLIFDNKTEIEHYLKERYGYDNLEINHWGLSSLFQE